MKLSLILTAVIVVIFGSLGWRGAQDASAARAGKERLISEARQLGVNTDDLSQKDPAKHLTRRTRDVVDCEAETKAFAAKLIAFATEMKAMEKAGQEPDDAIKKRIFEIMDGMLKLDAAQLKQLVAEVRAAPGLDDETRSGMVGFSIMMLASEHPEAALALFTESSDLTKSNGMSNQVISSALSKLAQTDPMAALDWIRKNSETHADLITDRTKMAVLSGAAKQDPKLAFSLLGELKLDNNSMGASSIALAANTPAEKNSTLQALRDYVANASDAGAGHAAFDATMTGLANKATMDGYDSTVEWLNGASMTAEEKAAFADHISIWQTKDDTGKWIDWMADKLPADRATGKIEQIVNQWTSQDYKAAAAWINDSKDGPNKDAAIAAYAQTAAPYEPESAAQWALTLPDGSKKSQLLTEVYLQWRGKDAAAAEQFAQAHGIQVSH